MEATQENPKPKTPKKVVEATELKVPKPVLDVLKDGAIPVVSAYLHQASMIAGTTMVEKTINSLRFKGAVFSWVKDGLLIELKDKTGASRASIIPSPSVASFEIDLKKLAEELRQ